MDYLDDSLDFDDHTKPQKVEGLVDPNGWHVKNGNVITAAPERKPEYRVFFAEDILALEEVIAEAHDNFTFIDFLGGVAVRKDGVYQAAVVHFSPLEGF